jgi:Cu/Ag efflux protein CusF
MKTERCKVSRRILLFITLTLSFALSAAVTHAQDDPSAPPQQQGQGQGRGAGREGGRPLFGKITAMHDGSLEITGPDGQAITVKLTPQTEFRKDREAAKVSDFKVGDTVMVRGDENADHSVTAKVIGGRSGAYNGPGLGGRPNGGMMSSPGTLGKDYVAGEVKSIDAPKLTVLRTDNVTQVLELNEDTSLRRGRDSITMADIKVGDHVMARGAVQNNVFVPKGVMVMNPEQWQRMQQMMTQSQQGSEAKPAVPEAPAQKPQE